MLTFDNKAPIDGEKLLLLIKNNTNKYKLTKNHVLKIAIDPEMEENVNLIYQELDALFIRCGKD